VFLTKWGSTGSGNGQFDSPKGLGLTTNGAAIYVSETYNHRVQKFAYSATGVRGVPAVPRLVVYPNPFSSSVSIRFGPTSSGPTSLTVYDVKGRLVTSLSTTRTTSSGPYTATWNGLDMSGAEAPTGIHFLRLKSGEQVYVRKVLFLK
jgi:hypothetical protein